MSLPPIPRPKAVATSLPSLPGIQSKLPATVSQKPPATKKEILAITVEDDKNNPDAISISFAGAGFDVENDEIVLDLLRLAVNSYGYEIFQMPDLAE